MVADALRTNYSTPPTAHDVQGTSCLTLAQVPMTCTVRHLKNIFFEIRHKYIVCIVKAMNYRSFICLIAIDFAEESVQYYVVLKLANASRQ